MFIEKIHRDDEDQLIGTKILSIKTKKNTITTPLRAAHNSWCNTFKNMKECKGKDIPTPWIEITIKIPNEEEMKNTIDHLGKRSIYPRSLSAPYRKKCLIEFLPVIGNSVKYDENGREKITSIINLGFDSKADVIGVPDFNENIFTFREKIRFVNKLIASHPEADNHDCLVYVRSDSRKFKDKLNIILQEDINKIGIEYHGYSAINKTNFNRLQNLVRDLDKDVLIKISHLTRKTPNTNASTPHLMYYYGADITVDRVNNPPTFRYDKKKKVMPPREIDTVEFFNSSDLGVHLRENLPDFYGTDCNCPFHHNERYTKGKDFFTDNADEMANRASICEMYYSNLECERSKIAIHDDAFLDYLKNKRCIRDTLGLHNNSLDGFLS